MEQTAVPLAVLSACPRDHRPYDWIAVATFAFLASVAVGAAVAVAVVSSAKQTAVAVTAVVTAVEGPKVEPEGPRSLVVVAWTPRPSVQTY